MLSAAGGSAAAAVVVRFVESVKSLPFLVFYTDRFESIYVGFIHL